MFEWSGGRKRDGAEQGLAAVEAAIESLPAAAYACDARGRVTASNHAARVLWGRRTGGEWGASGATGPEGTPLAADETWAARCVREQRTIEAFEAMFARPDGTSVDVLASARPVRDASGAVVGATCVLVDVSQRRRAASRERAERAEREAELADVRRLNELAVQLASLPTLQTVLDESLRFATAASATPHGMLALARDDAPGLEVHAYAGFDEDFMRAMHTALPGMRVLDECVRGRGSVAIEDDARAPAPDDDPIRRAGIRATFCTPITGRRGTVLGVLSTHFTEPHRASEHERRLLEGCARLVAAAVDGRRGEAGAVAESAEGERAALAHELRNPLGPIRNALELLKLESDDPDVVRKVRPMMERQVGRLARVVDDLVDTGQPRPYREPVELEPAITRALEELQPVLEPLGHRVTVHLPQKPVRLDADPARLEQLVANLVENVARRTRTPAELALTATRTGDEVVLSVTDAALGAPGDVLAGAFEMFTRNRPPGPGAAPRVPQGLLGMPGETVSAHSVGADLGSEFVLRLPALPADSATAAPAADAQAPRRRVLVVDDIADAAQSLQLVLERQGHEVDVAFDGDTAITRAREWRPDVVLLDIGLPSVSGLDVARAIRAESWGPNVTLIAMTGLGQADDVANSRAAGCDAHLVKPVELAQLERLMRELPSRSRRGDANAA